MTVSSNEPNTFLTDWWRGRANLFPARAKAAATALRDIKLFGTYKFRNSNESLEVSKLGNGSTFPERSFSWDVLSKQMADKLLDRSAFLHKGTGVPAAITWFFGISEHGPAFREVSLIFEGKIFVARIPVDNKGRYRLFWRGDFASTLGQALPEFLSAYQQKREPSQDAWMRFKKILEHLK